MGQEPNRTPSEHLIQSPPKIGTLKWAGAPTPKWDPRSFDHHSHLQNHLPQNGTIGFDPRPHGYGELRSLSRGFRADARQLRQQRGQRGAGAQQASDGGGGGGEGHPFAPNETKPWLKPFGICKGIESFQGFLGGGVVLKVFFLWSRPVAGGRFTAILPNEMFNPTQPNPPTNPPTQARPTHTQTTPNPHPHPTNTQLPPNPHPTHPTDTQPTPNRHPTHTHPTPNAHPPHTQPTPNPHPNLESMV